jgi:hypothetical protein
MFRIPAEAPAQAEFSGLFRKYSQFPESGDGD